MSQDHTHQNLLAAPGAGPAPTQLPADPAVALLAENGRERFMEIVAEHPSSSLCWALLAEGSLLIGSREGDVAAYAYARTGYHRGLDSLRRAGWKGAGPIPWEHVPNRGFLRALWALAQAAQRIGEAEEYERCTQFLRDSSETGYAELTQVKEQKPAAPEPVTPAPVVPASETAERSAADSDADTPDADKPDAAKPEAAKPQAAKPAGSRSTAGKPAASRSGAAKPAASRSGAAKPAPPKSAAAKPAAAKRASVTRRAPGAKPSSVAKSVATAKQAATAEPTSGGKSASAG